MITILRNLQPAIDFGSGRATASTTVGQPVVVWLQTIYNQDTFTFTLQTAGDITKISNYEYLVSFNEPGIYTVQLIASTIGKTKSIASNILNLNVTE